MNKFILKQEYASLIFREIFNEKTAKAFLGVRY